MDLLKSFFKDHILDLMGYISITALILLAFYLEYGNNIDMAYPLILVLFVVIVVFFFKGIRYYRFRKAIKAALNDDFSANHLSHIEQYAVGMVRTIYQKHYGEISSIIQQRDESYAFIAQVAHDLKIPISVMKLILEDSGDSSSDDNNYKIKRECDKILDKLSQLLCYLRIGQFDKDYIIEKLDLYQEIRKAINSKKDYFILHNIYPKFEAENEPIYILSDQKWHGILLDQIISNSIKYSAVKKAEGFVHFTITKADIYTELQITDYGIGIPSYDINRIFEPFFTGENGRLVSNSSGIGLYICKAIADKLGINITIESVPGEKTVVRLRYLT